MEISASPSSKRGFDFTTRESYLRYVKLWRREYDKLSNAIRIVRAATKPRHGIYPSTLLDAINNQRATMDKLHRDGQDVAPARAELRVLIGKMRSFRGPIAYVGGAQALLVALRRPAIQLLEERIFSKIKAGEQRAARLAEDGASNSQQFRETS